MPIPRSGGLGLHAAVLLAWPLTGAAVPAIVLVSLAILLGISAADDVRGLPAIVRFAAHVLAGGAVCVSLLSPDFGTAAIIIAALMLVWMINLYNFMDGSDGLAGGMALLGFAAYGIAAYVAGNTPFAWLNFAIAAAAAAFLAFNFYPARIFMGDAGSVPLGFLAGCFGLIGWLHQDWAWWFPLLVFSPFIVDASVTLARRLCAGAAIWQAHRDHYYQRLVRMGWGHRRTALAEYALMALCGGAALAGLRWSPGAQMALLAVAAVVYIALIVAVELVWRSHLKAQPHGS
jgi:UDP-N-acetylmuramyl pentapeptide phosphotransferase/UDP-N-acetylglucosamine-1-phosphate transferase